MKSTGRRPVPAIRRCTLAVSVAVAAGLCLPDLPLRAQARKGTVEHITVHGKALEGNLEGESPDRAVTIYLPPSYRAEPDRRFPVVYLLHGYNGTDATWSGGIASVADLADRTVAAGTAHEMILVMPNAFSLYLGSMYSNSATAGDWETYLAHDLVSYMDIHYRTIPDRMARGIAGHSMGAYGALRLAMKAPQVFSSVYGLSACCLAANLSMRPETLAAAEAVRTREDVAKAGRGPMGTLARAAAWSPNPKNPPLFLDLPVKDGKLRPEIVAKWAANAPLAMVDQYIPNLRRLHGIAFDVGNQDEAVQPASVKALDELLTRFDIAHTYETYDGMHSNKIGERIETRMLPFFSSNLSFTQARQQTLNNSR
jgi:S-formylglutathione hydrolase FrmB